MVNYVLLQKQSNYDGLTPAIGDSPNFFTDSKWFYRTARKEIQDNRATTHTTNHESLAPIYIHDISLILDKENVSK